ncbi:MAG: dihydroneopterin aldolase [Hyphomonadaceae bacterium]|nr:dihydroneopterin aldolase [Hyphomonadaceae bacterium]
MSSTVSIVMRDAELSVRIGEHAWEKGEAQRLRVSLVLQFGFRDYRERHGGYVNYDPLRAFLKDIENRPHTERLETLAYDILAACFDLTPADRVQLTLLKPDIFPEMQGVGLSYDVARADFDT